MCWHGAFFIGWQSALRGADTAGNENGHDGQNGQNGQGGTGHTECHVFLYFCSAWPRGGVVGGAHCAERMVGAKPTMNTMNTGNTIDSLWHTVSHVLRKFHGTWLTRFLVLTPVFLVFPVGLARSTGSAPVCAALRRGKQ